MWNDAKRVLKEWERILKCEIYYVPRASQKACHESLQSYDWEKLTLPHFFTTQPNSWEILKMWKLGKSVIFPFLPQLKMLTWKVQFYHVSNEPFLLHLVFPIFTTVKPTFSHFPKYYNFLPPFKICQKREKV